MLAGLLRQLRITEHADSEPNRHVKVRRPIPLQLLFHFLLFLATLIGTVNRNGSALHSVWQLRKLSRGICFFGLSGNWGTTQLSYNVLFLGLNVIAP